MNFEEELAARMRSSVEGVSAGRDLADVEARSARVHRRHRAMMASGVATLVVVAVGAVAMVGPRDGSGDPADAPLSTVPIDTPVDTAPTDTAPTDTAPTVTGAPTTVAATLVPTTAAPIDDANAPTSVVSAGVDRADPYLEGTEEIYRRVLPNGDVFVARMNDQTYASLFDIDWQAPTGSGDECLGDSTVLVGVPGKIGSWGSAWVAWGWHDDIDVSMPMEVASLGTDAVRTGDPSSYEAVYSLIRTDPKARQVVVVAPDGAEMDRADVVDGLAMVRTASSHGDDGPPRLSVVSDDGTVSAPAPIEHVIRAERPAECTPGEEPFPALPPPGEQPADPDAAEAAIRERHALLVDRTTPFESKPDDLLDDDTGVAAAWEQASTGPSKHAFATDTFEIDEVVFTEPGTAWFRYTIYRHGEPVPGHYGIAKSDGDAWTFTRDTICGDLLLDGVACDPPATFLQPEDPNWVAEHEEWQRQMELYRLVDNCSPLSQCS